MKRTLAIILIPLFFILLPILSGCGLKSRPKDDLVKQSVIEEADAEPTDEKAREIIQDSDTERQDYLELENTAQLDDNITPLPEDIEQLDDDAFLESDEKEKQEDRKEEKKEEKQKKPLPYKIQVDVTNQVVTVFGRDNNGKYTKVVRQMICSTGTDATPPPLGTFNMPGQKGRWGYFAKFGVYAQYWSRIKGGILFHSVIFRKPDESTLSVSSLLNLGKKASHGCIRLLVEDAKWIYYNIPAGTEVTKMKGKKNPSLTASLKPKLKPVKIELQTPGPIELLVGESKDINVRVTYQYGVVEQNPSDIEWVVNSDKVVSIKAGTIRALAPGKAEIKATLGNISSSPLMINVKEPAPEIKIAGLAISPKGASLIINFAAIITLKLDAKLLLDDQSEQSVTNQVEWTSSNNELATVQAGLVTAVNPDTVTISAKYKEGGKEYTASVDIKIIKPVGIIIKAASGKSLSIEVDEQITLEAELEYSDGSREKISSGLEWNTNNTSVVSVKNGTVKGLAPGQATITVKYKGLEGNCIIDVAAPPEPPDPGSENPPESPDEP